jgi:aminopeptidase YwaD
VKQIVFLSFLIIIGNATILAKGNKKRIAQIKADIEFLADDKLEGRRTGSNGEKLAASYIAERLRSLQIKPLWNTDYLQTYQVIDGKLKTENNVLKIFNDTLTDKQYGVLPCSANGEISELVIPKIMERGSYVLIPISKVTSKSVNNIHDDAMLEYEKMVKIQIANGAKGVIFYNDIDADHDYIFDPKAKTEKVGKEIVLFINHEAAKLYIFPKLKADWIDFYGVVDVQDNIREGRNVGGIIDNKAPSTVIIGAHFDHLGYGEDHNSLFAGKEPQIHNGADDNASGVAAILSLIEILKTKKYKNHNYIFLSFSGEELGLFGSKKFTEMNPDLLKNVNYMVNIDMLGRYNEEKKSLTIGGVGTSPVFIPSIENSKPFFTPKYDSAGVGPSDHTSFYLKDIPVLFFFTGLHTDYHKPSDDADKINIVGEEKLVAYISDLLFTINKNKTIPFAKTKEPKMEGTRFKVTLGIMPDYTFSGNGVKADGITDGKPAKKAGLLAGDIITQLGEVKVLDMQAYMEALSKFKKGDATKVKVLRGKEEIFLNILFE